MTESSGRHEDRIEGLQEIGDKLRTAGHALAKAAARLLSASDPQSASDALTRLQEIVDDLATSNASLATLVEPARRLADRAFASLDGDLREALNAREWRCDGQWPKYFVERAVEISVDNEGRTVTVGGRRVASASVTSIVEALSPLVGALLPKKFDPQEFTEHLSTAFDVARTNGSTAAILDVYRAYVVGRQAPRFWRNAVSEAFAGVSSDQFRARLSKALECGRLVTASGRSLRLLPPLDPKEGLFVYQPAERRFAFVGRIEFVREA